MEGVGYNMRIPLHHTAGAYSFVSLNESDRILDSTTSLLMSATKQSIWSYKAGLGL